MKHDGDGPTDEELRAFRRHPLTARLNREYLDCLERAAKDPTYDPPVLDMLRAKAGTKP